MNNRGFAPIAVLALVVIVAAVAGAGIWYYTQSRIPPPATGANPDIDHVPLGTSAIVTQDPITHASYKDQPSKIVSATKSGANLVLGLDFVSRDPEYLSTSNLQYINTNTQIRYFYATPATIVAPCHGNREDLQYLSRSVQGNPDAIWNFNIANGSVTDMRILLWDGNTSCPS